MRRIAWAVLLVFAFTIPWEYSLDLGAPLGNVARIVGLVLLLVAGLAVAGTGKVRKPGGLQWLTLALCLWLCCTYFWTIDPEASLERIRGYFQEMTIVWLVWEFAETPGDLRALLRAWLAGTVILAALTAANFATNDAIAAGQMRFAAIGQDPNDVARLLDLGFPVAALLLDWEPRWADRLLAFVYLPLGLAGVLLTASRGGFVAAVVALGGCAVLLLRRQARAVIAGVFALPLIGVLVWLVAPHETFWRLTTIPDQLAGGDLNQRLNIWEAGWRAFAQAPFLGHGAGSFVAAAGLASMDTAHNTALSMVVEGGICALTLASAIVVVAAVFALETREPLRTALGTLLLVWIVSSLVGTVADTRTTWLLYGVIGLARRVAAKGADRLEVGEPPRNSPIGIDAIPVRGSTG